MSLKNDEMEVKCNTCGYKRFIVKKPPYHLPNDHIYFSCTECLRERNKTFSSWKFQKGMQE